MFGLPDIDMDNHAEGVVIKFSNEASLQGLPLVNVLPKFHHEGDEVDDESLVGVWDANTRPMFKLKRVGFHEVEHESKNSDEYWTKAKGERAKKKKKKKKSAGSTGAASSSGLCALSLGEKLKLVTYEALARVTEARIAGAMSKIGADESMELILLEVCSDVVNELRNEVFADETDEIIQKSIRKNASTVLHPSIEDAALPLLEKLIALREATS